MVEFDRSRVEAFQEKTKRIGLYSQMETLDCIDACLAEIDRLNAEVQKRGDMAILGWGQASQGWAEVVDAEERGYRRGLEEAAHYLETDAYTPQDGPVAASARWHAKSIRALMVTPQEGKRDDEVGQAGERESGVGGAAAS